MFTKQDFLGYLRQLTDLEAEMLETLDRLSADVSDESVRTVLLDIRQDEVRHVGVLAHLRESFR